MPLTPKGRNEKGQFRNKHVDFKARVRRLIPCGAEDDVFDVFAGDSVLFRRCWRRAARGVTCDLEESCVASAAVERPAWLVLNVNVERALRAGLLVDRRFSIIDVDCYGSPWRFVSALFSHRRELADPCHLVLTDHYAANRNLSHEDQTLGYRKPGSVDEYMACVDRLFQDLLAMHQRTHARRVFRESKCVQHLIALRRA